MSHVIRKPVYVICEQRVKDTDQPAHPRSQISVFIVRCLDSILLTLAISKISRLQLASEAVQAGLSLTWLEPPRTGFLVMWIICLCIAEQLRTTLKQKRDPRGAIPQRKTTMVKAELRDKIMTYTYYFGRGFDDAVEHYT